MFTPNARAKLFRKNAKRDIFGNETFQPGVLMLCGIVNLATIVEATTVRADNSASRGAAEQAIAQAKILVPAKTKVTEGDVFELYGFTVEVTSVQPRVNTRGKLDHLELMGKMRTPL